MTRPELRFERIDLVDALLFSGVFCAVFIVLMSTMSIGIPRDESFYFHAGFEYLGWFEEMWRNWEQGNLWASFGQASVDRHMSYNKEHPALMKMLFGLGYKLFAEKLQWLDAIEAMRVPAVAFASACAGFTYLFGRALFGRFAGVLAVAFLFLQPRFFFHAHLACFDIPVVACWVAVVYGYWRSFDSRGWTLFTGIAWGIALSVKLNAFFLPIVLGLHWLIVAVMQYLHSPPEKRKLPRFPWVFVSMAVLGTILFFGLWPRHWFDTVDRVQWYLNFHLKHVHYFVYYLGENIQQPPLPISFPWVMTLVTVPATLLLSFVAGAVLYRRRPGAELGYDPRLTGWLLVINIVFPIALISMPETPIFGGTKHWATAMPFLSIVAAGGVTVAARALGLALLNRVPGSSAGLRAAAMAVVVSAVSAPAIWASVENHPFGTSYYNELIGSYRGAADARMMRQFWGYTSRQALPWVNDRAPENSLVWIHNTTGYAWGMYKRDELARKDLRPTSVGSSAIGLYHHQKAFIYMLLPLWESYGTRTPMHVVDVDGVPVLSVYVRNREKLRDVSRESDR